MRAFQIERFQDDGLKLNRALPTPEPGPGEVRLRVSAVALNYRDVLVLAGSYAPKQPLPLIPLSDAVGVVEALGEGVTQVALGDRVCPSFAQAWVSGEPTKARLRSTLGSPLSGVLAEQILVQAASLTIVPASLTDEEAACLPCAGVTAYSALISLGGLRQGDTVLVQGSGGVSLFALQIAKAHGARVIATSGSHEKLERLRSLGADHLIHYREDPSWGSTARRLAGGDGVDHVVEVGGAGTLAESLRAVRPGGVVSVIGVLAGAAAALSLLPVMMNQVRLQGVMVGPRVALDALTQLTAEAQLKPVIDRVFPFEEAPAAYQHLRSGRHFGKVVIRVSPPA